MIIENFKKAIFELLESENIKAYSTIPLEAEYPFLNITLDSITSESLNKDTKNDGIFNFTINSNSNEENEQLALDNLKKASDLIKNYLTINDYNIYNLNIENTGETILNNGVKSVYNSFSFRFSKK